MRKNKAKRKIYLRNFLALMAAYLVLMTGFSILLLYQQKTEESLRNGSTSTAISSIVDQILTEHLDSNYQITDLLTVKKELAKDLYYYPRQGMEVAVFTRDLELIYHTNDYWRCAYTEKEEGNKNITGYAYLNPKEWFKDEALEKLSNYIYAKPKAEKAGDLIGYAVNPVSFWLDNEMVIPEKIRVIPVYASSFDEKGNVQSSSGTWSDDDIIFTTNYINTRKLPHFTEGAIFPGNDPSENQDKLRAMVTDREKLERISKQLVTNSFEMVNPVTYRLYMPIPFQMLMKREDGDSQSLYSEYWTVVGVQLNLLEKCAATLLFVWLGCLVLFIVVAFILSRQNYRIYQKKEELDRYRSETTNAMAHDLKTPLSIISGYAQNLMENIHTEKREYYANNINLNISRMDKIIREMLELSRYEADSFQLNDEEISLGEVCARLSERYRQLSDDRHITIFVDGDAVIKADFSLIERVIDNFFVNALDYTLGGGRISIKILDNTLEFFNSGSHIPEEMLSEIWQPYKKADESRGNGKGSGLGLSISGKILDLYHFSYGTKNVEDGVIFWFNW